MDKAELMKHLRETRDRYEKTAQENALSAIICCDSEQKIGLEIEAIESHNIFRGLSIACEIAQKH